MPKVCIGQFPVKKPDRTLLSRSGNVIVQEWRGPAEFLDGLAVQMAPFYETIDVDRSGLIGVLRATTRAPLNGQVEPPVITFELNPLEQAIDLAFHPGYAGLNYSELSFVQKAIDEHWNGAEFAANYVEDSDASPAYIREAFFNTAESLYLKRRRGQDNYRVYGWTFTINLNVSQFFPTTIDFSNHGTLWTNAQVNAIAAAYGGIPNFTLPDYTATAAQTNAGLAYRWFRNVSTVQLSSRGSFNLTMGWEFALWDTTIYAAAS